MENKVKNLQLKRKSELQISLFFIYMRSMFSAFQMTDSKSPPAENRMISVFSAAQIRLTNPVVSQQFLCVAFHRNPSGFQHIGTVGNR